MDDGLGGMGQLREGGQLCRVGLQLEYRHGYTGCGGQRRTHVVAADRTFPVDRASVRKFSAGIVLIPTRDDPVLVGPVRFRGENEVTFGNALAGGPQVAHGQARGDLGFVRVHSQVDAVHGAAKHLRSPAQMRPNIVVADEIHAQVPWPESSRRRTGRRGPPDHPCCCHCSPCSRPVTALLMTVSGSMRRCAVTAWLSSACWWGSFAVLVQTSRHIASCQSARRYLSAGVGFVINIGGDFMVAPAAGILAVLYIVVAGLAVYALVLVIIFLRLRIAELRPCRPTARWH